MIPTRKTKKCCISNNSKIEWGSSLIHRRVRIIFRLLLSTSTTNPYSKITWTKGRALVSWAPFLNEWPMAWSTLIVRELLATSLMGGRTDLLFTAVKTRNTSIASNWKATRIRPLMRTSRLKSSCGRFLESNWGLPMGSALMHWNSYKMVSTRLCRRSRKLRKTRCQAVVLLWQRPRTSAAPSRKPWQMKTVPASTPRCGSLLTSMRWVRAQISHSSRRVGLATALPTMTSPRQIYHAPTFCHRRQR